MKNVDISYRLELLPSVPAFHRRAREHREFGDGELVYYGPHPTYYGIGEVKETINGFVAVDFRGTGEFGVHEDMFRPEYLILIPTATKSLL